MRHQKSKKTLDRKTAARKALLMGLIKSLILYEKIRTTESKARVVRPLIEKMVTRARTDSVHNRREIARKLQSKNVIKKMFEVLGPRYKERKGGYTRLVKLPPRAGDGARRAIIEFVK